MNIGLESKTDIWCGFRRQIFDFEGHTAWLVEPYHAAEGNPWTWTIEWPTAFVRRTGVPDMLARGWHHAFIQADGHGYDKDQELFGRFHDFLVSLGLAQKTELIGMSFGGLYSVRYAAMHPGRVACMYLDAPYCNFEGCKHLEEVEKPYGLTPWLDKLGEYPGSPVNLTDKVADIPTLLIYGTTDQSLDPALNAELFLARMQEKGADIQVIKRNYWGHHPHGLDEPEPIVQFFVKNNPAKLG